MNLAVGELKTAPLQGKALELGFHCFPWLIKKESTNYNWEEGLDVRARAWASCIRKERKSKIEKKQACASRQGSSIPPYHLVDAIFILFTLSIYCPNPIVILYSSISSILIPQSLV